MKFGNSKTVKKKGKHNKTPKVIQLRNLTTDNY